SANILINLALSVNSLGQTANLVFDIKRNGCSVINGPQTFIKEVLAFSGEYPIPWYTWDSNVPGGVYKYTLEINNVDAQIVQIDNYTLNLTVVKKKINNAINQIYP